MARWLCVGWMALALTACGNNSTPQRATAALPPGEILRLAPSPIPDMKALGAEITTRDQAEARPRIPGTLISLSVRAGDFVKKGQRIGMIVDSRLGFETSAYGAQVAAAQAEATRAHADLARIQDLYSHGVYAKARLDQAVAAARAASAQVAAARAQQSASASVAGQGAVLAPATGRVLRADIPAGSVVAPGMSIATVTAGPPVLRLMLPESVAGQIHIGSRVLVTDDSLPQGSREGYVAQVYPAVADGQVRVDAALPRLTADLVGRRIGASVEVGTRQALVVPSRFVTTRYGIDEVSVITADNRLSAVPVQVAPTTDPGVVEILSGVGPGDTLFAPRKGK